VRDEKKDADDEEAKRDGETLEMVMKTLLSLALSLSLSLSLSAGVFTPLSHSVACVALMNTVI